MSLLRDLLYRKSVAFDCSLVQLTSIFVTPVKVQSNFNGSNTFGTMIISLSQG